MSLRLAPLSNTERDAVVASLACGVRLDGRYLLENRDVAIQFGKDYGTCTVSLGETRVLAKVTCEVVEPRPSRPNEGKIVNSIHITPMAGPEFEGGRTNDAQVSDFGSSHFHQNVIILPFPLIRR
ncbi:Exoribonuclease phosphorolytic domain 1 [Trinorchestia longiramus]|nr:Exoribonuclease phosphorolytic domain 1 [Trinorchestia longiramus]